MRARGAHLARVGGALALVPVVSACSLLGSAEPEGSVFAIEPGDCFLAPTEVTAQISELDTVGCDDPHDQEAYAVVEYRGPDDQATTDVFPGDDALLSFADGACAQAFADYVGVDYLDSSLFYTYLVPSPRSWQEKDRSVVCFAIDSGRPMTGSVQGTKL